MRDTRAEAESVRVATIRGLAPRDRLRQALELSDAVRAVTIARLRAAHPGRSDRDIVVLLLREQGVELPRHA